MSDAMIPTARVEFICFAALEKATPQERADYLDEACGDDHELRRWRRVLSPDNLP